MLRAQTLNTLRRKHEKTIGFGSSNFMAIKSKIIKRKTDKLEYVKMKNCPSKNTIIRVKDK